VHHPLAAVGRQIDLFVPRHFFQKALDIRFFHEAEADFHGNNAATAMIAVEDRDAITVVPDVGHLAMRDFDEDEIARQDAVPLPQHLHDRRCAIARQPQRSRCHDDGIAFHERAAAAMKLDQFCHGHGRFRGIGRKRRLAAPAPGRHHEE
jgi:hypothetical protein